MLKKIKKFLRIKKKKKDEVIKEIETLYDSLVNNCDVIRFEIGDDIVPFAEKICTQIKKFRENKKEENGFILPAVRVIDNKTLQENEIMVFLRNKVAYHDFLIPNEKVILEEISLKLEQICEEHLDKVFTTRAVERYLRSIAVKDMYLICNITNILTIHGIKLILTDILREGKSIKDITYIFEKIAEIALFDGDTFIYNPHKISKELIKSV